MPMNQYLVQKGDTIAQAIKRLQTDWQTLRDQNPNAVGKSKKNGNWFLREGANVKVDQGSFAAILDQATKKTDVPENPQTTQKQTEFSEYTVQAGDTLWGLSVRKFHVNLKDLASDNGIENPDLLKVGQKLKIRQKTDSPSSNEVVASWYGGSFQGKPMANGAPFDMYANTIAHKDLPLGTTVELNNPRTGQTTTAVVTDRGPYVAGRDVDLSYGLARKLSLVEDGVDKLIMKVF
jgi:rare lipoprotein A